MREAEQSHLTQPHTESREWGGVEVGRPRCSLEAGQSYKLSKPNPSDLFSLSRLHLLKVRNPTKKQRQQWVKGSNSGAYRKHFSFELLQVGSCFQAPLSSPEAGES